ncbi:MAG: hypothetical protein K0R10_1326 [Alphaproteobacteria bacterium]|jgi:hypothetical protein|nr:hypothetical protein [Alphaproteobacteria bacterium]
MLGGFGDKRIRVRLFAIADGEPYLAPVEERERAFVGYIRNLIRILEQSPLGRMLVRSAMLHQVSVGLDPLLEPHASFFYPGQNHFDLGYQADLLQKSEKGVSRYLVSFIGALRRAWHHHGGRGPDVSLRPEDFLRLCRFEEADIEAVTHLIAWELRSGGASFLWRHLLSGANGDISVVFERMIESNPNRQFDGEALKAAFNQWFAERERINSCDHFALEMFDMALIQQGAGNRVGISPLRLGMIEGIGVMPNAQNYLLDCPFTSSWYDGLDDEFNRTHLRHIKQDISRLLTPPVSRR